MQECALCASSAYDVHHASVCVNVVIGVLVVLCELHVPRVVSLVVDAVVGLTLGLIAHVFVVVFVVAILHGIFCIYQLFVGPKLKRGADAETVQDASAGRTATELLREEEVAAPKTKKVKQNKRLWCGRCTRWR